MQSKIIKVVSNVFVFIGLVNIDLVGVTMIELGYPSNKVIMIPLSIIASIWIIVILSQYFGFLSLKDIRLSFSDIWILIKWFMIYFLIKTLGNLILIYTGSGITKNQENVNSNFSSMPFFIIFLTLVIGAPVMEELIFRGFIMKKCFDFNKNWGILFSGLTFGYLHGPTDIGSWIIYSSMGFLLAILYKKTDRIELPIMLHALNNLLASLQYIF